LIMPIRMKNMIKNTGKLLIMLAMVQAFSCTDYLDVVPEGTATLESAFSMRQHTLRYLYTCYSWLPSNYLGNSIDVMGGDEIWVSAEPNSLYDTSRDANKVARGLLTSSNNLASSWATYYAAIRDCNNFLHGIETLTVPDLMEFERVQWIAEVKALKAYYHFLLLRQYGPVPVVRENIPVSEDVQSVQVARNTVDEVVDYIVELLDEAMTGLPAGVIAEETDLGRITLPIAAALKAQALVTAASPLYNCNAEFAPLKNRDGTQLFPQDESRLAEKWERAADACREALKLCMDSVGMELYVHKSSSLTNTILQQMTLRQAFCQDWNNEVIWADTRNWVSILQRNVLPTLNPLFERNSGQYEIFSVPLKIAEMFYSGNGVPIDEDKEWGYNTRYTLRRAVSGESLYIRAGAETARLNFDREPRFYAWLGFPHGIWYGGGATNDQNPASLFSMPDLRGLRTYSTSLSIPTGYVPKKWVHYQTLQPATNLITISNYLWPKYRLAELLLYYAEALNETADSPAARREAMAYADMVRERAGLAPIAEAWSAHSVNPGKYNSQEGLREIIRHERLIELCLEGSRFWDLRRWKTAREELNQPVRGWSLSNTDNAEIYKPSFIFTQKFGLKDYFWPISEDELVRNPNLVQNLGW
jgi:hypothetical protein